MTAYRKKLKEIQDFRPRINLNCIQHAALRTWTEQTQDPNNMKKKLLDFFMKAEVLVKIHPLTR